MLKHVATAEKKFESEITVGGGGDGGGGGEGDEGSGGGDGAAGGGDGGDGGGYGAVRTQLEAGPLLYEE